MNDLYGELKKVTNDDVWELFYEKTVGDTITLEDGRQLQIVEMQGSNAVPANGEYNGDYTSWEIFVIFQLDDKFYRLSGTDDSWGAGGLDEYIEEVVSTEKVIKVWSPA